MDAVPRIGFGGRRDDGPGAVARPRAPAGCALPDSGHHERLGAERRRRRGTGPRRRRRRRLLWCCLPFGRSLGHRFATARRVGLAAPGPVGFGLSVSGFARLLHRLVELAGVQAGVVERVAATTVRQRQFGGHPDVLLVDQDLPSRRSPAVSPRHAAWATAVRATTRSARIPSTSKAAHSAAIRRNSLSGNTTSATPRARRGDAARQVGVGCGVPRGEPDRVGLVGQSAAGSPRRARRRRGRRARRRSGRTGRAAADAARPLRDSSCRSARIGRRGCATRRRARCAPGPSPRRRAGRRPGGRAAG